MATKSKGEWVVKAHWRKTRDGKIIWVREHRKGAS